MSRVGSIIRGMYSRVRPALFVLGMKGYKRLMNVPTSPIRPPEQRPPWDALLPIPRSLASDRHPQIVGHRGARGLAPENTLPAFEIAAELDIDGVEFDVQRTADGVLVVFHDDTVDRVTTGSGTLWEMTLDEVQTLDAGSRFDARFAGTRVPTLRETLEYLKTTRLLLFIELKDPWRFPGMAQECVDLVRELGLVERTMFRSFYHDVLHELYALAPEIAISALWDDRLPADDEVTWKTVDAPHELLTPENIRHMQARGQQVTAWTVNDVARARELMDAGIDGLCTDYPDRLLALFE